MNILSKLFVPNDIGIDLGAATTRVWVKDEGVVLEEPAVWRPMNGGDVPDLDTAAEVLRDCFAKVGRGRLRKPRAINASISIANLVRN